MSERQIGITEEQLAEIDARAAAATPGPWEWSERPRYEANDGLRLNDADADFITHARTDVPALVADIRLRVKVLDDLSVELAKQIAERQEAAALFAASVAFWQKQCDLRERGLQEREAQLAEAQAQAAALRVALELAKQACLHHIGDSASVIATASRNLVGDRVRAIADAALAPDAGRALLARVALLEKVAAAAREALKNRTADEHWVCIYPDDASDLADALGALVPA